MIGSRLGSVLLVATTLLAALAIGGNGLIPEARAAKVGLALEGFAFTGWNNTIPGPTITVVQGNRVSISLVSGDGATHRFFVDVDHTGTTADCHPDKCSKFFSTTTTYSFGVNFPAGAYKYYCALHPFSMVGDFRVLA